MDVSGFVCLMSVLKHYGMDVTPEQLLGAHAPPKDEELNPLALAQLAIKAGLRARASTLAWERLPQAVKSFPLVLKLSTGGYVVAVHATRNESGITVIVHNPQKGGALEQWNKDICEAALSGDVIFMRRQWRLNELNRPFGLLWFVAEALREPRVVTSIVIAAIALHVLALATPFFTQIIIDKVLAHRTESTLIVLSLGVLIATVFETFLGWAKGLMMLHVSAKMDMRVARRIFSHLLALPISFFEKIPSGVLAKHVEQYTQVREFLMDRLFGTVLDSIALLVYLPLLYYYSPLMATVVLLFSLLIAGIVAVVAPRYRSRLETLYQAEAERQSLLVESLHGMSTIKALSLEPARNQAWDRFTAIAADRTLSVGDLTLSARAVWQFVEKSLPIVVVVLGVYEVMAGNITVGTLIAFQMISGRVISPITQMAALINDFQRALLSISMLKNIMVSQPEQTTTRGLRPSAIVGEIEFDNVSFVYAAANRPSLDRVSFKIPAGAMIGIVGQSGSGKTTLTRILQGFYPIHAGQMFIDGVDARELDKSFWRQRIGVVPQQSFLFRGTIKTNIGLGKKEATFEEIVEAAKLAGAHDFITRLPEGYDTQVEEGAINLSGGQGQRIAIARALLRMPKVLIFDEATSALDPESERIIQSNMSRIAPGRTVIIVSHRIKSLRAADKILVLEDGQVVGYGSHDELMMNCPAYRLLEQSEISNDEAL